MATINGGGDHDSLVGTSGADSLWGASGNDTLQGGAGNDTLNPDAGSDLVFGGAGDDTIFLSSTDTIYGGEGTDTLDATFGGWADTITFTSGTGGTSTTGRFEGIEAFRSADGADYYDVQLATGDVTVSTGNDNDTILGGSGNDRLSGDGGADSLAGGAGRDTLTGGSGNDGLDGGSEADILSGDSGDDRLYGGSGSDNLSGGDGADLLEGGADNDNLSGGEGKDTLVGGSGIDVLSGGGGEDEFRLVQTDSGDVITDFDLTKIDNRTVDQLDVSDLRDSQGSPVQTWQVGVSDDGYGNTLLSFPGGESVILQGVSAASFSSDPHLLHAMGVPCFASGSLIDCPGGARPVEDLQVGDLVLVEGRGAQPILWSGQRQLSAADLAEHPDWRPIRVEAGALGNDRPLTLSPQHSVLCPGTRALVRARHLINLHRGVRVARGMRSVVYHHILLPQHSLIRSHGMWSESLYPGPMVERMFLPEDRARLSLAIARHLGAERVPKGGLAALYGPRCLPVLSRSGAQVAGLHAA